jgi:pimeloyl-ACP methyl ester carboxylesterase
MPINAEYYYHYHYSQAQIGTPVGLPVVLLHGAGGTNLSWPAELRRMPGHRIYALDLPGHGKSGGRGLQSISAYADRVLFWMSKLNLPGAVFIGHSMGAAIALTIALQFPDQILGLGLVGAAARLPVTPELLQETSSPTTIHNAIEKMVRWSYSPASPERLLNLAARRLGETRPSVLHGDLLACNDFDITEKVSSIHTPTIILCGIDDKMTPLRHSQYLASQIEGAVLQSITEAGHMVMLEKPIAVANVIKAFLMTVKK